MTVKGCGRDAGSAGPNRPAPPVGERTVYAAFPGKADLFRHLISGM
jgi:hypothetical protein